MRDQSFINSLADFTQLKKYQKQQQTDKAHKNDDNISSNKYINIQTQLDLHNNQKIIKNFKDLREQLKQSQKIKEFLRFKVNDKSNQIHRLQSVQKQHVIAIQKIKNQFEHIKHTNQDYKEKLQLLKDVSRNSHYLQQQSQFLKITINDLKNKINTLETQKTHLLEFSITQKIQLQQKLKKLQIKQLTSHQYTENLETQSTKLKQKIIKLQNQLKKMTIKYDQQFYNYKYFNQNHQYENILNQLKQIKSQYQSLTHKYHKQKNKNNQYIQQILTLQQNNGLLQNKINVYKIQNKNNQKYQKKLQKKIEKIKIQSNKKIFQNLVLQQKYHKSSIITQQLINRIKKQLFGDIVTFTKSCQFKLNKIKQDKEISYKYFNEHQKQNLRKSVNNDHKTHSKSKPKFQLKYHQDMQLQTQSKTASLPNIKSKPDDPSSQKSSKHSLHQKQQTNKISQTHETYTNIQPLQQLDTIQNRIKKQRDEMQKKIKQKIIYRKLQIANQVDKYQLRSNYIKIFQN